MPTLIIPAVSTGNIPQLAADLLLHNYDFGLVAQLDDEYVYPFAGPRDGVSGSSLSASPVTTAVEAFKLDGKKDDDIFLIQCRTPILPGKKSAFIQSVVRRFVEAHKITKIIILSSSNAGFRPNLHIERLSSQSLVEQLHALNISVETQTPDTINSNVLPEAGITTDLLRSALIGDISALVRFAYEGDNTADATELAKVLAVDLDLEWPSDVLLPDSWRGIYGKSVPIGLEEGLYA